MRVAVCVSGQVRGNYKKTINRMRDVLPYDFYFHTWDNDANIDTYKKELNIDIFTDPEPPVLHVPSEIKITQSLLSDPKVPDEIKKYYKTHLLDVNTTANLETKRSFQILAHWMLLKRVPSDYDMIIRLRWDSVISLTQDWDKIIRQAYDNNMVMGFSTLHSNLFDKQNIDVLQRSSKMEEYSYKYLTDFMIVHRREKLKNPFPMYEAKELFISHTGWWQVLCDHDNEHINFFGGVDVDRSLKLNEVDYTPTFYKLNNGMEWIDIPANHSNVIKNIFAPEQTTTIISPIIILRDPFQRFVELFEQYFMPTGQYAHLTNAFLNDKDITEYNIRERVNLMCECVSFFGNKQQVYNFYPQTYFIPEEVNCTYIMDEAMSQHLNIPYNIKKSEVLLTPRQKEIVRQTYENDFMFIEKNKNIIVGLNR